MILTKCFTYTITKFSLIPILIPGSIFNHTVNDTESYNTDTGYRIPISEFFYYVLNTVLYHPSAKSLTDFVGKMEEKIGGTFT